MKLVVTNAGIDRRYYELCVLAELKNALRSGDIWVVGSRQFKDFDETIYGAAAQSLALGGSGCCAESTCRLSGLAFLFSEGDPELREYLGLSPFGLTHYRQALRLATARALQTDNGVVLASDLLDSLRKSAVIVPSIDVIERVCAEALTRTNRDIHGTLTEALTTDHRLRLDRLLKSKRDSRMTQLAWLRQSPIRPNSRHMLEHIERLRLLQTPR